MIWGVVNGKCKKILTGFFIPLQSLLSTAARMIRPKSSPCPKSFSVPFQSTSQGLTKAKGHTLPATPTCMSSCATIHALLCTATTAVPCCSSQHTLPTSCHGYTNRPRSGRESAECRRALTSSWLTPSPLPGFCSDVSFLVRPSLFKTAVVPNLQTRRLPLL